MDYSPVFHVGHGKAHKMAPIVPSHSEVWQQVAVVGKRRVLSRTNRVVNERDHRRWPVQKTEDLYRPIVIPLLPQAFSFHIKEQNPPLKDQERSYSKLFVSTL